MGTSEPSPAVTLTPSQPGGASDQPSRSLAASQARLNEIVAPIIRGASVDRDLIARTLDALREHNWASGFAFEGTSAPGWPPLPRSDIAILATRGIELKNEADAARARAVAYTYDHVLPPDAAALTRRLKADAPALVYVITHAALGAAKIGVSDAPGSRIAEHRRAGWPAHRSIPCRRLCGLRDRGRRSQVVAPQPPPAAVPQA